ncbi:MAG: RNA methyltransferase [Anaerolineales bacterium]|nr:RNA methyltransferase [Anaerolineales bacterium]
MDKALTISSRSNTLVKQARALRQRKERQETGLFLIEGIHHVGEAAEAGWEIETLLYAPQLLTSDFAQGLVEEQSQAGLRCQPLTADLFAWLADKENPQGILAIARQRHLTLGHLTAQNFSWGAAAVAPQDPGNVGSILRTIDAVGADGLFLLDGGVDPYHPSAVRASMGALFWKPVVQASFDDFVIWARKNGCHLVGSSSHTAADYRDVKRANVPTILVLGSEQKGLTPEQAASCDLVVSMPMRGRASSLNLAVAAGVLLYALMEEK